MRKYILLFVFFPSLLFAQNNGDSLKFEIIKASIGFLSTAKATNPQKLADCKFSDGYECLKKYCTDSKLEGGSDKIVLWSDLKQKSGSKDDLQKLADKAIKELTTGNSDREKRANLPSFEPFKKTVYQLASAYAAQQETATTPEVGIDEGAGDKPKVGEKTEDKDAGKSESKLPLIALILSIVSLVFGGLAFVRIKGSSSEGSEKSNPDYYVMKEDLKTLSNIVRQKQSVDLSPFQSSIKSLESRITNLENRSPTVELSVPNQTVQQEQKQDSNQPSNNLKYARYPDMSNGFTNGALKDSQNGELIFEIQVSGNNASFSVSDDPSAQAFALSDYKNYLSDACDFANQPYKGCHIITQSKGSLSKTGGNWIIQSKAKIEFK